MTEIEKWQAKKNKDNNDNKVIMYYGVNNNTKVSIKQWKFEAGKYNSTSQPLIMRTEFETLTYSVDTRWFVIISEPEDVKFNCINAHYISKFVAEVNRDYEIKVGTNKDLIY